MKKILIILATPIVRFFAACLKWIAEYLKQRHDCKDKRMVVVISGHIKTDVYELYNKEIKELKKSGTKIVSINKNIRGKETVFTIVYEENTTVVI